MSAPLVERSTGDIIPASDHNDVKDYIEDGTYRVNTLSLSIGGTEVIDSGRMINDNINMELEHACEIIEIQADAALTLTPMTHDGLVSETFSDTDGYNNLVNTGNTKATFDTNKYMCSTLAETDDTATERTASTYALVKTIAVYPAVIGSKHTNEIKTNQTGHSADCKIKFIYEDDDFDEVEQSSYLSSFFTVTYTCPEAIKKVKSVEVYIKNQGSSFRTDEDTDKFYTISGTRIIEIDLPTITGTITATQLVANCPDRETGDAVTYKLIDSASAEDDALELDTENTLVNCDGTKITGGKIQIQLIPKATSPTEGYPSCKTFALKLYRTT